MKIGVVIKNIRKKKGVSQKDLAIKSDISSTYLSQIEGGSRSATIDTLERIGEALEVPFPILSFLSLDKNDINPNKRDSYEMFEPTFKAMIQEFFVV